MNQDPQKSAQPSGCDEGANHKALDCIRHIMVNGRLVDKGVRIFESESGHASFTKGAPIMPKMASLPTGANDRKKYPIWSGVLMYFPDALLAVSRVSHEGNEQHNPGEPLHWARDKSTDQLNTAMRHMLDYGTGVNVDTDGTWHLAKAVWRLLAELQLAIEKERPK